MGTNLRYVLTRYLQLNGPTTVADLVVALDDWGFTVAGRPSKAISDALRWERGRDRVGCGITCRSEESVARRRAATREVSRARPPKLTR
nr:hypothetical protein [Mycolicibacterium vinylchloridicum]